MSWMGLLFFAVLFAAAWVHGDAWDTDLAAPPEFATWTTAARPQLIKTNTIPGLPGHRGVKPVVCADDRGNVLIISHGTTNTNGSDILLWRSIDRGSTWGSPRNLTNRAKDDAFYYDMWLETDHRGRFYCVYGLMDDLVPHLARSRDAGKTWQLSINIGPAACDRPVLGVSPSGRYVVVAASMSETTDAYSGKPFDSRDPRLEEKIAAANRFYSGIFVSSDYGANWQQYEGPMDGKNAIPFAVVIDDSGSIASSWVVEGDGSSSVVCISTDEGQTWSQTTLVDSLQPDRSHPFNGERFPVLTVDGNSGLHVAYVTAQAESLVVRSSDDWKSWQEPIKLSGDEAEEVRMAAIDAYGALVHVTWMERSGEVWHAYYCGSHDHGRTWANPVCLSGGMGRLPTPANGFQLFGDDDQSSVRDDGQGRVHAVWAIRGGQIMHAVLDWKKTATARVQ